MSRSRTRTGTSTAPGVAIVRLFNTVGPRQTGRYGMVVPNLVNQALRDEPLTVFGDGRQTRCFSYVRDVVPAIVALAEAPEAYGRAVNLGGAEEVSILDLAERVIRILGSSSVIEFVPYEHAYARGYEDMRRRVPDITLARELIGFDPSTRLDDIIRAVAAAAEPGTPLAETMPFAVPVIDGAVIAGTGVAQPDARLDLVDADERESRTRSAV